MLDPEELKQVIPLFFEGVAVLFSLRAFIYNFPTPLKTLSKIWIAMFLVEMLGHTLKHSEENYWLYNIFHIPFYFYLAYIYFEILESQTIRTAIQIFYFVFIVFAVFNTIFFQGLFTFQTLTIVFGGCFVSFLAGSYFSQMINSSDNQLITRDPFFWVSFGLAVYFGGTVPFLGMFNYLLRNYPDFHSFYFEYIYYSFSIFLNIIISIAFLCRVSYQKSY